MEYEAARDTYSMPSFYNATSKKVIFASINSEYFLTLEDGTLFLKKAGTYKLILNVLELTIDAEKLS